MYPSPPFTLPALGALFLLAVQIACHYAWTKYGYATTTPGSLLDACPRVYLYVITHTPMHGADPVFSFPLLVPPLALSFSSSVATLVRYISSHQPEKTSLEGAPRPAPRIGASKNRR